MIFLQGVRIFHYKTKGKGKCPRFLHAFRLSFVDPVPVRLFLHPETLSSAWTLPQHHVRVQFTVFFRSLFLKQKQKPKSKQRKTILPLFSHVTFLCRY